jgi:ribose/xylose/arabinose/galactoside ABC-type transport system permease subunit
MLGGVGTMIGMWVGVLVLGELQDGFNLRGISSDKYQIILGVAILVFMILNTRLGRLRGSGRLVGTGGKGRGGGAGNVIAQIGKL